MLQTTRFRAALTTAALLAGAALGTALPPRDAHAADEAGFAIRGTDRIQVKGKGAKAVIQGLFVTLSEAGHFVVAVGDEFWEGDIVGTGADMHVELQAGVFERIESAISIHTAKRLGKKFVTRELRDKVTAARAAHQRLVDEAAALQARVDDLNTRISNAQSGGTLPADLLLLLIAARNQAVSDKTAKDGEVTSALQQIAIAESALTPEFGAEVTAMDLTFRTNRARTKVKVKAVIDFTLLEIHDHRTYSGRRKVTGRGPLSKGIG